jgi:hypothetical protein
MWENAIDGVIDAAILVLSEELREIVKENWRKRGRKCRNWIAPRESLGASNCLFRKLLSEDPKEFFRYQQRQKNGKESRKHLKLGGISPTVAELLTGSIAK